MESVREAGSTGAPGWTNKRGGLCCAVLRGRAARCYLLSIVFFVSSFGYRSVRFCSRFTPSPLPSPTTMRLSIDSSTEVALNLTITSLEGGTVRAPTPTSDSNSVWAKCPPSSQKIVLVLARTGKHVGGGRSAAGRVEVEGRACGTFLGLPT